jgi:Na+/H+ antiporter NhaD/arsenite permease-like protein
MLLIIHYFCGVLIDKVITGLVPIAGGTLILILDAILNKRDAKVTLSQVDWSILVMFFGIFVWLKGNI